MHRAPDLRRKLLEIAPLPSDVRWGRFEALLYALFKRGHFRVERASRAAGDRQLDLVASDQSATYFVEAKWHHEPVGPGELDGLTARLVDAAPGTVGVLISPSGFTSGVPKEVTRVRRQPVLLIGPEELGQALEDPWGLRRLLKRKLDHFLVVGDVLVGPNDVELGEHHWPAWNEEPARIVRPDGQELGWVGSGGGYGNFVFAQELTDVDWTPRLGCGASVDLRPQAFSLDEFEATVVELQERGWLTPGATWIIEQAEANWHGFGCASLIEALRSWDDRYSALDRVHHTEQFAITDSYDGRLIVVDGDVSARKDREFSGLNLSLHLPGIPVDAEPLLRLAETVGDDEPLEYRPLMSRSVERVNVRHGHQRLAEPVAMIVESDRHDGRYPDWVRGIVVPNPRPALHGEGGADPELWPSAVADSEFVLCSLGSWHPLGEHPESYELRFIEWAWTSDYAIMRYVADWKGKLR